MTLGALLTSIWPKALATKTPDPESRSRPHQEPPLAAARKLRLDRSTMRGRARGARHERGARFGGEAA